jgi:hypothetical protein
MAILVSALAGGLILSSSVAHADAPKDEWQVRETGWSRCDWSYKSTVSVKVFSNDLNNEGFPNTEFNDRVKEAVSRWDVESWTSYRFSYGGVGSGNVTIRYIPSGDWRLVGAELGYAWINTGGGLQEYISCAPGFFSLAGLELNPEFLVLPPVLANLFDVPPFKPVRIVSSTVYVARRPDWFTRNDTDALYWERLNCVSDPSAPWGYRATNGTRGATEDGYLCSKDPSFSGLALHELGHSQGLHHPQTMDSVYFLGIVTPIAEKALCSEPGVSRWLRRPATMCNRHAFKVHAYATLDGFDKASLRDQLVMNATID